jgi:hypothetical protein
MTVHVFFSKDCLAFLLQPATKKVSSVIIFILRNNYSHGIKQISLGTPTSVAEFWYTQERREFCQFGPARLFYILYIYKKI